MKIASLDISKSVRYRALLCARSLTHRPFSIRMESCPAICLRNPTCASENARAIALVKNTTPIGFPLTFSGNVRFERMPSSTISRVQTLGRFSRTSRKSSIIRASPDSKTPSRVDPAIRAEKPLSRMILRSDFCFNLYQSA